MHEPHDDELILYYYGEAQDPEAVRRKLAASPALRAQYDELCRVLTTVETHSVPEPPEDYASRVWHRLAPQLRETLPRRDLFAWLVELLPAPRQLLWAGGMAAIVVVAFLAGRYWPGATPQGNTAVVAERPGERILLVAVGRHLERSEMLLVELVNAEDSSNFGPELRRADDLLSFNRLYRQAARRSGEEGVADLLEELERLLLELAHSPEDFSPFELASLRERIEDGGMLFRMRIVSARMERDTQRKNGRESELAHHLPPVGTSGEV